MYVAKQIRRVLLLSLPFLWVGDLSAQCGPTTPTFTVNLNGQPNGSYLSPSVSRDDNCCGSTAPDRCIKFVITLDPQAVAIQFDICVGAVPPGALFYQINCGPPIPVGQPICVQPPYPIILTFCKPGNNQNQYCIKSIYQPSTVGLSKNCGAKMWAYGLDPSTITWNSINPGPIGAYNNFLSCQSGCDSTWVHPQAPYPPFIDYKVCGTPMNGCNNTGFCDTIRVVFPPPVTLTVTPTSNVTCFGGTNGSAFVGPVTGGIPAYTYSWNPWAGWSPSASGFPAGTHTVTVTDSVGCKGTASFVITQPTQITGTYTTQAATCSQANGSATIYPSGGTPGYTFMWSNGQTTATITGLSPGVYGATVTDISGCTYTVQIAVSNVLPIVTVASTSVTCSGGANGTGTSIATGGIPPYTYVWSPGGQTTSTATGLSPGTYTVATASQGCINYQIVTIAGPPTYTGTVTAHNNVSCYGGNNGNITVSYSGGTPGYTYLWSNGQIGPTATGLTPGSYSVTVRDANGCILTNTFAITQPAAPLGVAPSSQVNINCNGWPTGSATAVGWGGTPNYTYYWTGGQTSSAAIGLTAGNYTITIVDAGGCTSTATLTLTEPPAIVPVISGNNVTPCGAGSAVLSGSATGGAPGYSYSWSTGATTSSISVYVTSSTTYTLVVTDKDGCTKSTQATVNVFPLPVAAFNGPSTCLNNSTVFTNTSSGGVQWTWNFGEPTSGSNNVSSVQNPSHTYAAPGTYTVSLIVVSANGCSDTISHTLTINPLPSISFTSNTVCQGNTTTFNNTTTLAGGNVTGWTWNFADPGSGPNNISTAQNPTHIFSSSGTFNVILTATTDSGCQSNTTQTVIVYAVPTPSFVATKGCSNVPVYFTDASTYGTQWIWDFGNAGSMSSAQNPSYTYPSPGMYVVTLTVTSAGGCPAVVTNTITIDPSPSANFTPDSVCVGASSAFIDLSVAPGGSVTGWEWDFGDGSPPDTSRAPRHVYSFPGTYTVTLTITSDKGCKTSLSKPIIVFPQPTAAFTYSPGGCIDEGTEVQFTDHSFSNVLNWYWYFADSGSVSFIPHPTHVYHDTGSYSVALIVQDANGCFDTAYSELCVRQWTFYIPNAFTPNGNGKNDFFFGKGIGIKEYEMWLFDRWGNLIYHCEIQGLPQEQPCQWDGKVEPEGLDMSGNSGKWVQEDVYVWKVRLLNVIDEVHNYVGSVTVVK